MRFHIPPPSLVYQLGQSGMLYRFVFGTILQDLLALHWDNPTCCLIGGDGQWGLVVKFDFTRILPPLMELLLVFIALHQVTGMC